MAEISWGHNIALIEKIKEPEERLWYAAQPTPEQFGTEMKRVYKNRMLRLQIKTSSRETRT